MDEVDQRLKSPKKFVGRHPSMMHGKMTEISDAIVISGLRILVGLRLLLSSTFVSSLVRLLSRIIHVEAGSCDSTYKIQQF